MTLTLILLLIVGIALASPRYGVDSRDLARGECDRDKLWAR